MNHCNSATPIGRKPIHTRHVICDAFLREDGLIDVEGEMRDIAPDGTDLYFRQVAPGGPIHHMRIVMTVGTDLVIHSVRAQTHEAPSHHCREIEKAYDSLAGLEIGLGFMLGLKARVGGVKGCTHLTEMLGPMATTAIQARLGMERHDQTWRKWRFESDEPMPRPRLVDSCHTYREDGEAIQILWPPNRRQESEPARQP